MVERTELYCHECNRYVQFDLEDTMSGDLEVICPNCGHVHCRVVENGVVTDVRWGSRNGNNSTTTYVVTGATTTSTSINTTYVSTVQGTGAQLLASSWNSSSSNQSWTYTF